jgi:hypothetical protein
MPRDTKRFNDREVMGLFKRIKTGRMLDNDGLMLIDYLEQLDGDNCHSLKVCDPIANEYYKGCAMIVDKLLENFAKCTERKKKSAEDAGSAHN